MNIGILGSNGYVGSQLYMALSNRFNNQVTGITRHNFNSPPIRRHRYDFLIHSANPARRFLAEQNPLKDFEETVDKIDIVLNEFRYSKLLLISSLSCRTQPNTYYGAHRLQCENKVLSSGGSVVRLGPMYAGVRGRSTLDDIVESKPVFFSQNTRYSYANVLWNASYISSNLSKFQGISEVGARNSLTLLEIAQRLNSKSQFGEVNDDQIIENFNDGPDSYEIFRFLGCSV